MKKNDYLLLTATFAYSFLFFKQNAGLNFLLFTLILLVILILKNRTVLKNKTWCWAAFLCLITAVSVFVHSSTLSIIANITSLLVISALSLNVATSTLFSFLFGIFSMLSSLVYMILDRKDRVEAGKSKSSGNGYKLVVTVLAFLLSMLFFTMYKSSNPLFSENTKWINFNFISMGWIIFTLGGFLLMYGFLYPRTLSFIETWENNLPIENTPLSAGSLIQERIGTERYAGLLLFMVLNIMLIVLNSGDIQTLYFNGGLPPNISHSDFVHGGVGMTILSILIATGLIMYLFRKEFTAPKGNLALKICMYLWIAQNMIMLSSTAMRNRIYVQDYNFTYKRVGVYVWIVLAVIGLIILFLKIHKQRSNWYLVRANVSLWFTVLALSSSVNWDKLITRYNIANKPLTNLDLNYLASLSDANLPELLALTKEAEFKTYFKHPIDHQKNEPSTNYRSEFEYLLNQKIWHFVSEYNPDLRSFDLRGLEIRKSIY